MHTYLGLVYMYFCCCDYVQDMHTYLGLVYMYFYTMVVTNVHIYILYTCICADLILIIIGFMLVAIF